MKKLILPLALTVLSVQASAQEIVVGAGYTRHNGNFAIDDAAFTLEYHHSPFYDRPRLDLAFGAALSGNMDGDLHAGIGVVGTYDINERWFVEASVMPGSFWESISDNTLGSRFQIRSLLAVGYKMDSGNKLSLAITHKSNASTTDYNPGLDTVLMRYHVAF
ncbi:acyloxyacyl hydrolase [Lutimaribacter marinistellae]|uniref:Acyloxyacyl hydrolase n=1 Tax=Lutimaribacter marinistellae TaxID=1820329 RepID=A0ABV7TKN3_9RHOB